MDLSKLAGMGLSALAEYAPTLASMIGGPLAGMAVSGIESVLGIAPTGDANAALTAVAGATPDQMLALKAEDNRHAEALQKAGIDLEAMTFKDRDSARQRESAVKDWTPRILAGMVIVGWLAAYAFVFMVPAADPTLRDLLTGGLRTIDSVLMLVMAYYFGSSAGSAAKDATIRLATGGK